MFDWLARGLGYIMYGCSWLVGNNYVIALLLFAIVMQVLLCPFGIKQQKNMIKQAYLRPKEMAIRKKYAGRNDNVTFQKMRNEIMSLQQEAGYSPLSGCLPMILQLILIFPIYNVAVRPLEFIVGLPKEVCNTLTDAVKSLGVNFSSGSSQVQLAGWLHNADNRALIDPNLMAKVGNDHVNVMQSLSEHTNDFSFIPDVSLFGQDLGVTPWDSFGQRYWWLVLIPVINLALMYVSQIVSRKLQYQNTIQEQANGAMGGMNILLLAMPLLTMGITFSFAAAIGIYWIFRTLLSMLQQFILYKTMPYPTFTEEDYRNAEKELKGKRVSKVPENYVPGQREIRSLHHIDDDE